MRATAPVQGYSMSKQSGSLVAVPHRRRVAIAPRAAADYDIATSTTSTVPVSAATEQTMATAHLAASLAAIVAIDKSLEGLLCKMGVAFPAALCGMFGILGTGVVESKHSTDVESTSQVHAPV